MSIATLGLHIIDVLARPVPDRKSDDIIIVDEMAMTVAGTAAAPALTIAKLGGKVSSFGVVGADEFGEFLIRSMRECGVDVSSIVRLSELPTSSSILTVRQDGSRPGMHVIGATEELRSETFDRERLFQHEILFLGGLGLIPHLDGKPAAVLLREAKERGITTAVDTILRGTEADRPAVLPALEHTDYFFPNDEDALRLTGESSIEDAIMRLHSWGVKNVLVTRGGEGATVSLSDGRLLHFPTLAVPVVDTTGCGDAFAAGFLLSLDEGQPIEECVRFALACGSLTATRLGSVAGITDREQVEAARAAIRDAAA